MTPAIVSANCRNIILKNLIIRVSAAISDRQLEINCVSEFIQRRTGIDFDVELEARESRGVERGWKICRESSLHKVRPITHINLHRARCRIAAGILCRERERIWNASSAVVELPGRDIRRAVELTDHDIVRAGLSNRQRREQCCESKNMLDMIVFSVHETSIV